MAIKIAPSLLAADFTNLQADILAVEQAGADLLHLDIMDGQFVPNITFGPDQVAQLDRVSRLPLDVHLMIKNPEQFIDKFAAAGARMISIHPEATYHPHRVLQSIRNHGIKAGLAINPATPLDAIPLVMGVLDFVLIMTVNPGFGGQEFITPQLDKIKSAKQLLQGSGILVEVDGSINSQTAAEVIEAGADILVAGTAIFGQPAGEYSKIIAELRQGNK